MRLLGDFSRRCPAKMDMSVFLVNGLLALLLVTATIPDVMARGSSGSLVMDQELPPKKCRYSKAYSMLQVRCTNLDLEGIPQDLKSDIQVLDVSVNRLRELTNESFVPYKSLAYLYLGDNFIHSIQEAAFANQHYLQVLDLSKNGCDDLPRDLFHLPYLRKVYLADNKLNDFAFYRREVKSPLQFLQLAKNKLCKLPEIGLLPTLLHLNVSDNLITGITTEELASFCSLEVLDLSKNPIKFDSKNCECQTIDGWLKLRGIRAKPPINCTEDGNSVCSPVSFSNRTLELYEQCSDILRLKIETEKARNTWILVACCVAGFIFCLFVGLFCVHKRNKKRKRKLKEEQRLAVNNANTELLNSNLNRPENT